VRGDRLGGEVRILGEDLQQLVAAFLPVEDRPSDGVLLDRLGELRHSAGHFCW